MIDKIDTSHTYDYAKVSRKNVNNTEPFDISDYAKEGAVYEKKKPKEQETGVTLDLSQRKDGDREYKRESGEVKHASGLTFEQIRDSVRSMLAFLKDTWKLIWEDAPKQEAEEVQTESPEAEESVWAMDQTEEENSSVSLEHTTELSKMQMQKAVSSRNLEVLTAMLTNNGKRKPAKNSALLTTYDRRGRIVKLDEAEEERILHGDKNFIKL